MTALREATFEGEKFVFLGEARRGVEDLMGVFLVRTEVLGDTSFVLVFAGEASRLGLSDSCRLICLGDKASRGCDLDGVRRGELVAPLDSLGEDRIGEYTPSTSSNFLFFDGVTFS